MKQLRCRCGNTTFEVYQTEPDKPNKTRQIRIKCDKCKQEFRDVG